MWNPFKSKKMSIKLNFLDYIYLIYFYATIVHKQTKDRFRYGYGYYITLSLESNFINEGIRVKDLKVAEPTTFDNMSDVLNFESVDEADFDEERQVFVPVPVLVDPEIVRFLVIQSIDGDILPSVSQLRILMYTEWLRSNNGNDMTIPCINMISTPSYFSIYALIKYPGVLEEDAFYRLMREKLTDYVKHHKTLFYCIEDGDFKTVKDYFETIGIYFTISDYNFVKGWNPNPRD